MFNALVKNNNNGTADDMVFISRKTAGAVGTYLIKKLSLARYVIEPFQSGTIQGFTVRLENRRGDTMGYASGRDAADMKANPLIELPQRKSTTLAEAA